MATVIEKIVDPDNGAGTDYTSLAAAISGEVAARADLVTRDEQLTLKCRSSGGTADSSLVTVNGFTTDATRFVKIIAFDSDRATAKWDSSKYRLAVNSTRCLVVQDNYVKIEGIQIDGLATNTECVRFESPGVGPVSSMNNCFLRSVGGALTAGVSIHISMRNDLHAWNNIVHNCRTGFSLVAISKDLYLYANTIYGDGLGTGFNYFFQSAGNVFLKNNIAQNNVDGYTGPFHVDSDYNLSDVLLDAPGSNSKNGVTVSFVDISGDDFHLADGDTAARASGTDLSGDAVLPFSNDIDNETRWEWSMGADDVTQPVVASAANPARFPSSNSFLAFPSL